MGSAYVEQMVTRGIVCDSISDAVARLPMIIDSSRYWEVFDAYRQQLPEKNIKIVWLDEDINNRALVYQNICSFLEIADYSEFDPTKEKTNDRSNVISCIDKLERSAIPINTN